MPANATSLNAFHVLQKRVECQIINVKMYVRLIIQQMFAHS